MTNAVFDKTDKGREEIATRKHQLDQRLRPVLVMVDGKKDAQQLLRQFAAIGLDSTVIDKLKEQGFIQEVARK